MYNVYDIYELNMSSGFCYIRKAHILVYLYIIKLFLCTYMNWKLSLTTCTIVQRLHTYTGSRTVRFLLKRMKKG